MYALNVRHITIRPCTCRLISYHLPLHPNVNLSQTQAERRITQDLQTTGMLLRSGVGDPGPADPEHPTDADSAAASLAAATPPAAGAGRVLDFVRQQTRRNPRIQRNPSALSVSDDGDARSESRRRKGGMGLGSMVEEPGGEGGEDSGPDADAGSNVAPSVSRYLER